MFIFLTSVRVKKQRKRKIKMPATISNPGMDGFYPDLNVFLYYFGADTELIEPGIRWDGPITIPHFSYRLGKTLSLS